MRSGRIAGAKPPASWWTPTRPWRPCRLGVHDEIIGFFGDWTLVEPGLTDIWAWRAEDGTVANTSGFMRILGGVARKD